MAIKLSKEEENCPICKIPFEKMADKNTINKSKVLDKDNPDIILEINYTEIPSYYWKCSKCGCEVTIGK